MEKEEKKNIKGMERGVFRTSHSPRRIYINAHFALKKMKVGVIIHRKSIFVWRAGGMEMAFSYNKLWKLLIDKNMMKKDLMEQAHMNSSTMAKLGKNMPVSMDVLGRVCKALDCNVGDIVDYVKD